MSLLFYVRFDFTGMRKTLITRWLGKSRKDWVATRDEAEKFSEADAIAAVKKYGGRVEAA